MQWLTGLPRDSYINLLSTSSDGTYVFITNSSQVEILPVIVCLHYVFKFAYFGMFYSNTCLGEISM